MLKRWAGLIIAMVILGGVILIVVFNLDLKGSSTSRRPALTSQSQPESASDATAPGLSKPAGFREYPIGEAVEKNKMRIAAVWLPSIQMDGGAAAAADSHMIHLEADIHATEANPNGFAKDEFVPYMAISYKILPPQGKGEKPLLQGDLMPMVAADGLHYGASLMMPTSGEYRLVFAIKPPSAGGLGRHSDPATGVAPWWEPFEVAFDWDYEGLPRAL